MRVLVGTRERRKSWTPRPLPVFFLLFASGKEKKKRRTTGVEYKRDMTTRPTCQPRKEKREDSLDIAVVCW